MAFKLNHIRFPTLLQKSLVEYTKIGLYPQQFLHVPGLQLVVRPQLVFKISFYGNKGLFISTAGLTTIHVQIVKL